MLQKWFKRFVLATQQPAWCVACVRASTCALSADNTGAATDVFSQQATVDKRTTDCTRQFHRFWVDNILACWQLTVKFSLPALLTVLIKKNPKHWRRGVEADVQSLHVGVAQKLKSHTSFWPAVCVCEPSSTKIKWPCHRGRSSIIVENAL